MKTMLLRGLAALALFTLAPCAQAIVISQSHTYNVSINSLGGGSGNTYAGWGFSNFAAYTATSPLLAVQLTVTLDALANSFETNPYSYPVVHGPGVQVSSLALAGPLTMQNTEFATGPAVTIAPSSGYSFQPHLLYTWSQTWTAPAQLAPFTVAAPQMFSSLHFVGLNSYGSLSVAGNATITLAYTNAVPAPEGGGPLPLFAAALGLGWLLHRRRSVRSGAGL